MSDKPLKGHPLAACYYRSAPPAFLAPRELSSCYRLSSFPAHFFTRNRGELPDSGVTFDASLPSFHAATHFFAVCIALFIPDRGFYTKEYPASSLFITR